MTQNKIDQLIKMADIMIKGTVEEFPKNLVNFKLVLESVKMAIETPADPTIPTAPMPTIGGKIPVSSETTDTSPETKPKRKRRTKAEMLADASKKLSEMETKIDDVESKLKESDSSTEAWEITLQSGEDKAPWEDNTSTDNESPENEITNLINKYPDPLNVVNQDRDEKIALIKDIVKIKELVGNKNSADIKTCLEKIDLSDAIAARAYKFLMVLPLLETEIK
jgi:hypothetical protein